MRPCRVERGGIRGRLHPPRAKGALKHGGAGTSPRSGKWEPARAAASTGEEGSAIIEFVFLAVLLMIPVVYLVLTVGQLQGGAYAAVGAADQAAKVFAGSANEAAARAAAETAVELAAADIGLAPDAATLVVSCSSSNCLTPGSSVTATVRVTVPLPLVPTLPGLQLEAATLEASASQQVGRFR